jgi:VanZ family protein
MRFGYVALGIASIVPGQYRPSTVILPDTVEHALAYLLIGGLSVLAARSATLTRAVWLASAITAYAGVLELCQALLPGRVASIEDFLASAIGGVIGISLATLSRRPTALRTSLP